jgi:hypothetical protein
MRAPCPASLRAIDAPIPELAPVTSTVFPSIVDVMSKLLVVCVVLRSAKIGMSRRDTENAERKKKFFRGTFCALFSIFCFYVL